MRTANIIATLMLLALASAPVKAQKPVHGDHGMYRHAPSSMIQSGHTFRTGMMSPIRFHAEPGFRQTVEIAAMFTDISSFEAFYNAGYRFGEVFYLGGGVGFGCSTWDKSSYIPVYANPVFYISDRKVAPMVGMKLGFMPLLNKDIEGDHLLPMVEIRPGVCIHLNGGNDINVGLAIGTRPWVHNEYDYETGSELGRKVDGAFFEGGLCVGFSF